jgi:hypothetical protein
MNNRGHTLAELMIYMIMGLTVAGFSLAAMKQMSRGYVRGREVSKLQYYGRDAINIMARDIVNTGFKYYIHKRDTVIDGPRDSVIYETLPTKTSDDSLFLFGSYISSYVDLAGILPADSAASFFEYEGSVCDTLEILRSKLARVDSIGSVERTSYFIKNDTLFRINRICTNPVLVGGKIDWGTPDTIAIIENAKGLQFQYSKDGYSWVDSPSDRSEIKHIRVQLVIRSARSDDISLPTTPLRIGNADIVREPNYLYRVYEQVITIRNNGILVLN